MLGEGVVNYESQIERDFFLLCHHAPDVISFLHQPIAIAYKDIKGKEHTYHPDCYVKFDNGIEILVEIKDENTFQNEKNTFEERWNACKSWANQNGLSFIVLTDVDIRNARLANIWFTLGSSKVFENKKYVKKLLTLLNKEGIEYNVLCYKISEDFHVTLNKASQILSYAIFHGYIFVDTFSYKPITKSTVLRKRDNAVLSAFKPLWQELDEYLEVRDASKNFEIKPKSVKELKKVSLVGLNTKLNQKEEVVKEFLATSTFKRNKQWREAFQKKHKVNISTIYKWVKAYEDRASVALNQQYSNSGRKSKWDDQALTDMEEARKYYLKPNVSIKKAYEDYLIEHWAHSTLEIPSLSSFKRYVKNHTTYYEKEIGKKGSKRKRDLEPSLKSFQGAIMPMQVLQFDNTPFDLFLKDSEYSESIGTPHLCAAIDVYTRMITGFELTLNPINRQSILETLVQSITPKYRFLESVFSNEDYYPHWDIEGFPVIILVDNGMDYRAKDIIRFCKQYDIILEYAPIRKPRYKAYIENWFNNLKNGIAHELGNEGYRPKLMQKIENPDINPEHNIIFTFQQSELWLTSWILDYYHLTNPYNDGLPAPVLRFEDYEKGIGDIILPQPRDPPSREVDKNKLQLAALMSDERTLKDNIDFVNLKYSSSELVILYKKKGKIRITILYDTRDIRVIWAVNPDTNEPIELNLTYGWANAFAESYGGAPISISYWSKEVQLIKERNRARINLATFRKDKGREYRLILKSKTKNQKQSKKKRRAAETIKENQSKIKRKSIITPKANITQKEKQETKKPKKKKWKEREVDWSKVKLLPTDKMYKG